MRASAARSRPEHGGWNERRSTSFAVTFEDRRRRVTLGVDPRTGDDATDGLQQDAQVEPDVLVIDVPDIQLELLIP
jgi:hypothetical protein